MAFEEVSVINITILSIENQVFETEWNHMIQIKNHPLQHVWELKRSERWILDDVCSDGCTGYHVVLSDVGIVSVVDSLYIELQEIWLVKELSLVERLINEVDNHMTWSSWWVSKALINDQLHSLQLISILAVQRQCFEICHRKPINLLSWCHHLFYSCDFYLALLFIFVPQVSDESYFIHLITVSLFVELVDILILCVVQVRIIWWLDSWWRSLDAYVVSI